MDEQQVIAEGVLPEEGKFCADCKHLIGVRHSPESKNWNCGHSLNDLGFQPPDLVTGIRKRAFRLHLDQLRYTTDEKLCGKAGLWYEQYIPPDYSAVNIGGEVGTEIVFDDAAQAVAKEAAQQRLAEIKAKRGQLKVTNNDLENL